MEFNKRKFNIFVIFTICLICVVVAFSAIDFSSAGNVDTISDAIADKNENLSDEVDPEEKEIIEQEVKDAPIFTVNQKWQCLNYALNNFSKYDYRLIWSQDVKNSFNIEQNITRHAYKISGKYYVKLFAVGFENYTKYFYVDSASAIIKNGGSPQNFSYNAYKNDWGCGIHQMPFVINQSTCKIKNFISDPFKDYYELQIEMIIDQNANWYKDYIVLMKKSSSNARDPIIYSIGLTIKIDKKLGTIKTIIAKENYSIAVPVLGRANCVSIVTLSFTYNNYASSNIISEIKSKLEI